MFSCLAFFGGKVEVSIMPIFSVSITNKPSEPHLYSSIYDWRWYIFLFKPQMCLKLKTNVFKIQNVSSDNKNS